MFQSNDRKTKQARTRVEGNIRLRHASRSLRIVALLGLGLFLPGMGYSATFTVNSTADVVDLLPGDATCFTGNLTTGGPECTLRAAIQEANALAGADKIILLHGEYFIAIAGAGEDRAATGDLDITEAVTIEGTHAATTVIDGAKLDRIFDIGAFTTAPIDVLIKRVTVRNGRVTGFNGVGGGIRFGANLTIDEAVITGNESALRGAGIGDLLPTSLFPNFTLRVTNSTVSNNRVFSFGRGGGIGTGDAQVVITHSAIQSNVVVCCSGGGGLAIDRVGAALSDVTVSGNSVLGPGIGGGIVASGAIITRSTISGNTTVSFGGGFAGGGTITNSTISGNSARGGGGINALDDLTLNNVTIADNVATALDFTFANGLFVGSSSTVRIGNTIMANVSPNCGAAGGNPLPVTAVTSAGHNLATDGTCQLTSATDLPNTDPQLDPLANNGGPTQTRALRPGSPAIDAGNPAGPGSGGNSCEATDQRGLPRPADGNGDGTSLCDIGSLESLAEPGVINGELSGEVDPSSFAFNPAPAPGGPAGTFIFSAEFCNIGAKRLTELKSVTTTLSGGNALLNRDTGTPPGVGSKRTFPITQDLVDGVLAPGECVDVLYIIGLTARAAFDFLVDVVGVAP